MQHIPVSQGHYAIVDDDDFELLSEFKWCYRAERNAQSGYAVRHHKVDGRDRLLYLHRQLMKPPEGHEVVFLNFDKLDCRRANLRVVTKEEARRHHRVRKDSKSGIKGVRYNPGNRSWSAYVYRGDRCYHIGTYHSQDQATAAHEQALRRENPDLNTAPERVERPSAAGCVQPAGVERSSRTSDGREAQVQERSHGGGD